MYQLHSASDARETNSIILAFLLQCFCFQDNIVRKDFNIEVEANGTGRPVVKYFNATVHDGTLEIRFYWASKGTTRIPNRGDYGSLISAISVYPSKCFNLSSYIVSLLTIITQNDH